MQVPKIICVCNKEMNLQRFDADNGIYSICTCEECGIDIGIDIDTHGDLIINLSDKYIAEVYRV